MTRLVIAACLFLMTACTSVTVTPLDPALGVTEVCVRRNDKVQVDDFLPVLLAGFSRHGIKSTLHSGGVPEDCGYVVSYTARRSWDLAPYLSQAEIWVMKGGTQVAHAEYHLIWKGGFSLMKWQGTEAKIAPVLDEMLGHR